MNDINMPDQDTNELSLRLERRINAPVEKAYAAWLKPETLMRFMNNCEGIGLTKAETDPRVGGRFLLIMTAGDQKLPHSGTYLELTPHSRIRFTWESEHSAVQENSEVTLTFTPDGDATLLNLTHVRFANEAGRDQHIMGWTIILTALTSTAL
jgi:uncharacterized protein YndB with AHSA1/START domain